MDASLQQGNPDFVVDINQVAPNDMGRQIHVQGNLWVIIQLDENIGHAADADHLSDASLYRILTHSARGLYAAMKQHIGGWNTPTQFRSNGKLWRMWRFQIVSKPQ